MEVRFAMHPSQFKTLTTEEIRKEFLIEMFFLMNYLTQKERLESLGGILLATCI